MESLDFMTFACKVLDSSLAFDKFDVGSVQIEPTEWPTAENSETGKKYRQVLQIIKKNTEDKTCEVKNKGSTVSCGSLNLPVEDTNTFLDGKLEASKRKLRDQYDKIENEKKKRRIQIVEFQNHAVQVQTKARKPPVVKRQQSQRNGPQLVRPAATQLHRAHHVFVC